MLRKTRKTLLMFALTVLAALALAIPAGAAAFSAPDSDGYVPEYYRTVGTCYDGTIGMDYYRYRPSSPYGPHVHFIEYDACEMKRLGATSAGWARLKAHERAHSRGLAHYEGTPATNPAYYPTVNLY